MQPTIDLLFQLFCFSTAFQTALSLKLGRPFPRRVLHPLASATTGPSVVQQKFPATQTNPTSGAYDYDEWKKAFVSQTSEFDYILPTDSINGSIPSELEGSLFRNMPALFERGGKPYGHYLDGDGYVTRLSISNGKAHFSSRFVKTKEYVAETSANKILYRSTFRTQREPKGLALTSGLYCFNNGFDLKLKNLANTNVIQWGDKLIALFEAGVPYLLDPESLDTIGQYSMGIPSLKEGLAVQVDSLLQVSSKLHNMLFGSSMTAHPKVDSLRSKLVGWTWRAAVGSSPLDTNPVLHIREWEDLDDGICPPAVQHKLTTTTVAPHDFSITDDYYVFIENRVQGNTLPYVLGVKAPAQCVDILPSESMVLNLVPRPSEQDRRNLIRNVNEKPDSTTLRESFETFHSIEDRSLRIPLSPGFTIHSVCAFQVPSIPELKFKDVTTTGMLHRIPESVELFTTAWKSETVASGQVKGGLLGSWEGAAPLFDNIPVTLLYRTVIDAASGRLLSHAPFTGMENTIVEHPHINPLFEGQLVRYMYMSIGSLEGISSPPLGYLRLDLLTGQTQQWFAPLHTYCEEVVIVPKERQQTLFDALVAPQKDRQVTAAGAAVLNEIQEDAVWVLASMFDATKNRSCVGIFDGESLENGPVSNIWLDHPLPHSLHGCFARAKTRAKRS